MTIPHCQGCGAPLTRTLVDLGTMPLANSFVKPDRRGPEPAYPLHARVCDNCLLVQVDSVVPPGEIFSDYLYFSSYSDSWLAHARLYAAMAIERFALDAKSMVVEIASNDGYLLTNFIDAGIPCLGIEPAANVAKAAIAKGVPTEVAFFGTDTARRLAGQGRRADLLAAKNVLAHVPDINDFVAGIAILLKPEGVFTVEFPHLMNLIAQVQFDTIYHEHFTYLSLLAIERVFARHGLRVFDVEEIATHGGSLRVFVCLNASARAEQPGGAAVRAKEVQAQLDRPEGYQGLAERVDRVRRDLLAFLDNARSEGRTVAAYGAAAKGNTLLNFCGIGPDRIAFVADRSTAKQGLLLPGSRIPVLAPDAIFAEKPDYVVVLPWNLIDELSGQLAGIAGWGGRLVTAIPHLKVQ
ncbi:MAG: class I SAM-dependent methyltransferase [Pseudolabrys sp.]|nr:class I SAM-dependent methyltransferase [Pseudolabrys sp.]